MEKEKVLEIEFKQVWDKWAWRIVKQDENILKRGIFKDDEIRVMSSSCPCLCLDHFLYIKGMDSLHDDDYFFCIDEEKTIIEQKVKAINEKYGKPKRWRAEEGGWYYSVNISGRILRIRDGRTMFDDDNYNFSNYFQTEEQAEKARELQKKAYQEV